ncbi:MAG UNVERIFIED_CONTAM: hypothetical protein LVR18_49565 [Planctomycetaceae bacterium]
MGDPHPQLTAALESPQKQTLTIRLTAPPRTRTQSALADGTRTRTRKTPANNCLFAASFAASRLRVRPTACTTDHYASPRPRETGRGR